MIYITKKLDFSAAHRVYNPNFTDEENANCFGRCNNPNGHGHNYELEVTIKGEVNPETGYLMDLKELKSIINREIIDKVDHKFLNYDVDFLQGIIPSSENLCIAFWNILKKAITQAELHEIKLYESKTSSVTYRGE